MYLELKTPIEIIETYLKDLILQEVEPDGLLSDIKSTKTTFKDLSIIDTPTVWIYLGNWYINEKHINRNNSRAILEYEVEVVGICNRPDIKDSDREATSIQARLMEAVTRNWKRVVNKEYNILCQGVTDVIGYTDGKIAVASKQKTVAVKGITFKALFDIDWMRCLQKQEENNNKDDDGVTDDGNNEETNNDDNGG